MKKQTTIIYFLCIFTALASCKKSTLNDAILNQENKSSLNAGHPVYDLLGYGYDVTGRFADSESARMQVLNIEKFVSMEPASLPPNADVSTDYDYYFGENASTYSTGLSQKYNATLGLKVFGGEVKTSFKDSSYISSKNVYAGASMFIQRKHWKLYSTAENLRNNYLSSNFLADIATLSPKVLVQRYGTHVLTDITLGARFNVNYKSETSNSNRMSSAQVGLKFHGLAKIVGFDGSYDTNTSDTQSNFNEKLYYRTSGGDGTKGLVGDVKLDNTPLTLNIGNWQSSTSESNAVLIRIGQDGFVPLDELISNPAKSAEVKAYIKQYLIDSQFTLTSDKTYLESDMPNGLRSSIVYGYNYPNIAATRIYPSNSTPALVAGGSISSPNGLFTLTLQTDGNLVLYRNYNGRPALWNSVTQSNPIKSKTLFFQTDGNLVLYQGLNRNSPSNWASNRYDRTGQAILESNSFYALQDDGNFVFYFIYGSDPLKCYVLGATGTNTGVSTYPGKLWAQ